MGAGEVVSFAVGFATAAASENKKKSEELQSRADTDQITKAAQNLQLAETMRINAKKEADPLSPSFTEIKLPPDTTPARQALTEIANQTTTKMPKKEIHLPINEPKTEKVGRMNFTPLGRTAPSVSRAPSGRSIKS